MSQPTQIGNEPLHHRALLLSSALAIFFAMLASGWEFLASQSPWSPLHVGPLAGPIGRLASACWLAGVLGLALRSALGGLGLSGRRERRLASLALAGWWPLFLGHALAAALGTHGVQVIGAYPRVVVVLIFKLAGYAVLAVFAADFLAACISRLRR